jgi:hypothetical protein
MNDSKCRRLTRRHFGVAPSRGTAIPLGGRLLRAHEGIDPVEHALEAEPELVVRILRLVHDPRRDDRAASGFTFFVMFLPYPSSAFVPVSTMPSWIHGFAENQPATPVIETIRGLLLGTPLGSSPWRALAWCGGIRIVSVVLSSVLFRRRVA